MRWLRLALILAEVIILTQFVVEYWLQLILTLLTSALAIMGGMVLALFGGVRALLRDRIIQAYNHYVDKGCCPIYGLENVERMYKAYHVLRGNGTVTRLVEELKQLPRGCGGEREEHHED